MLACTLASGPGVAHAAPGDLDPAFGFGGVVTTNLGTSPGPTAHDYGRGLVLEPGGSIVLAGTQETSAGTKAFAVARYTAAGVLDASFGSGGKAVTTFPNAAATGVAAARQPDGKIVVAGGVVPVAGNGAVAVARFLADGTLDASFGSGGRVTTDLSTGEDYASAIGVQPDGKLVVAATASTSFAAVRYNPNGTLDASFGSGGKTITPFTGLLAESSALALLGDGRIVVVGTVDDGLDRFDMAAARYTSSGVPDATFGTSGTTVVDVSHGYDFANAALALPDGKLVLAGQSDVGNSTRMALVRLTFDGALDASFGSNGSTTADFADFFGGSPYALAGATSLAIQGGRLVLGGYAGAAGYSFALTRYSMDGVIDTSFGNAGRKVHAPGGFDDQIRALAVQPDGKIVAGGYSYQGSYDFAVARYAITYASGADLYPFVLANDGVLGSDVSLDAYARNEGPQTASNVVLTVTLPNAVAFESATPSQGSCAHAGGVVTCQLGSVAPGEASVHVVMTPSGVGTLYTRASVSSSTSDPYAANASTLAASRVRSTVTSFGDARTEKATSIDDAGHSTASASGSAERNGALRADTAAASDLPVGVTSNGVAVAHATATHSSNVLHTFAASGPIFTVTAVITSASQTVVGVEAPRIAGYRDGSAAVHGSVRAYFYPCGSVTGCAPATSAVNGLVVSQPGLSRPSVTVTLTIRSPAGFSGTGALLVAAGLTSSSSSVGDCTSYARTSGTVAQISVA